MLSLGFFPNPEFKSGGGLLYPTTKTRWKWRRKCGPLPLHSPTAEKRLVGGNGAIGVWFQSGSQIFSANLLLFFGLPFTPTWREKLKGRKGVHPNRL